MLAEWTAECTADDPTIVVPWSAPEQNLAFVNLREHPYELAEIEEANRFQGLGRALRALNSARSPFLTAKCDVWSLAEAEHRDTLRMLQAELDLEEGDDTTGFGLYIDLIWRERSVFASAHQQTDKLSRLTRRAEKLLHRESAVQFVLRPALLDFAAALEGFATTMYVTSLGADEQTAATRLEAALESLTHLLRSRDLEPAKGSATIEF